MVNQQVFLPMIPDSAPIVINIAQYDYDAAGYAGRLYFNLISNGTAYDMDGATAVFQGEKPDGTAFAYAGTVVNSSVVRVNVRQQMTVVAGRVICQLVLNNSEGQIGSYNVWLEVQESATSGSTPSQTDIPALVAQAQQYANDAQQAADDAGAYTGHPAYIGANNNWFIYDITTSSFVDSGVSALGEGIVSITKTGTAGLVDTYTITYTNGSTTTFDITNGSAPNITVTAQADATSSATPTVTVTQGGTLTNPTYDLAFSGLKGEQGATGAQGPTGATGNGIASITKTGTAGLVDTYTITFTDGSITTFNVTNGQNGTGSGDMIQTQYDPTLAVFNAGGIVAYVTSVMPTTVDVVDNLNSTSSTKALSANMGHEINNPTITAAASRANIATGDTLTTIWGKIAKWFSDLKDLAFIAIDGVSSTKFLRGDGTWQNIPAAPQSLDDLTDVTITSPANDQVLKYSNGGWVNGAAPAGGHTMINNATYLPTMVANSTDATDDKVASTYAISNWSNAEITTLIAHISQNSDTVGVWNDAWETDGIRTGWVWHECLYHTIPDNEVEISIDFAIGGKEVVGLYAYRVDDEVAHNGVNGGAIAIKLTSPIQNASGVDVAINLKRQRTNLVPNPTILS